MRKIERLLLTIWVGSLFGVGYVAVPVLFRVLEERSLAGSLAGEMFALVAWVGLICGAILLVTLGKSEGVTGLRNWRGLALVAMLVLTVAGRFILQPMIGDLRDQGLIEGSDALKTFRMLHGVSSILYLITSVLGAVLVAFGLRPHPKTTG